MFEKYLSPESYYSKKEGKEIGNIGYGCGNYGDSIATAGNSENGRCRQDYIPDFRDNVELR